MFVQRRLQEVFNDANRTKIFWQRLLPGRLSARKYPPAPEAYWIFKIGAFLASLSAAAIGVYSLFPLVRDNEFPENKTAGIVLGSGMLITNAWIWTYSLYDFVMNSLNPKAYFADTFRDSSKKDIALRTVGSGLAFCFGLMMGLIPLLENKSDTVGEKILTGMEFGFGVGINILISMIGIGAVWQYFMGWIKPVMRDMVYGDINALKQAFFALPLAQKQEVLGKLIEVLHSSPITSSPSCAEAGTSASAAAAVASTSIQPETRVTIPQRVYGVRTLGGQILSFFKPANLFLDRRSGNSSVQPAEYTPLLAQGEESQSSSTSSRLARFSSCEIL